MATSAYALLVAFIDGNAVYNLESISQKTNAGLVPIKVLNHGFVGVSKGAGDIVISGSMFVPGGGFEVDVQKFAVQGSEHTMQIGCGSKDWSATGWFFDTTIGQSTDQGTKVDFEFHCPPSYFE